MTGTRTPLTPIFKNARREGFIAVGNTPQFAVNLQVVGATGSTANGWRSIEYITTGLVTITGFSTGTVANVDVSNPATPSVLGSVSDATLLAAPYMTIQNAGQSLVGCGGVSPNGDRVTAVNTFTNPAAPTITGSVTDAVNLDTVTCILPIGGGYALALANDAARVTTVDVSNPAAPSVVANLNHADLTECFWIAGVPATTLAVVVCLAPTNRLIVIDYSNPLSLSIVSSTQDNTYLAEARHVLVNGGHAWVCSHSSDLVSAWDLSNPVAPVMSGYVANSVLLDGANFSCMVGSVLIVAANNDSRLAAIHAIPTDPVIVGSIQDTTNLSGVWAVDTDGVGMVYATAQTTGRLACVSVG